LDLDGLAPYGSNRLVVGRTAINILECCDLPSAPEWYRLGLDLPTSIAPG